MKNLIDVPVSAIASLSAESAVKLIQGVLRAECRYIQGTGGIRKLRWARQGSGKSGGIRVIYYVHNEMMPVYLLAAFGKNEKANISAEEKHLLSKVVQELVEFWRKRNEQGIH